MASGFTNTNGSKWTQTQRIEAEGEIANYGPITMDQFKVALGVLSSIAVVLFIGRIVIRVFTRGRMYMDDKFLIFAFTCLCGGTFILYERTSMIYLEFGIFRLDSAAYQIAEEQSDDIYNQSKWQLAYSILLWTTIFAVKWCYFALFHSFLQIMSKGFNIYYKFSICFSVVCWLFVAVGDQLIACPYIGEASEKCFPKPPASNAAFKLRLLVAFWSGSFLDCLTDLSVISIPIAILRQSQMKSSTKAGLGCFLCLSAFMLSCSIVRAALTYYGGKLDYPWLIFWLHSEGCISVMMGSLTVYRPALIGSVTEVSNSLRARIAKIARLIRGNKGRSIDGTVLPYNEERGTSRRELLGAEGKWNSTSVQEEPSAP